MENENQQIAQKILELVQDRTPELPSDTRNEAAKIYCNLYSLEPNYESAISFLDSNSKYFDKK